MKLSQYRLIHVAAFIDIAYTLLLHLPVCVRPLHHFSILHLGNMAFQYYMSLPQHHVCRPAVSDLMVRLLLFQGAYNCQNDFHKSYTFGKRVRNQCSLKSSENLILNRNGGLPF